jgi:hypothetical protein
MVVSETASIEMLTANGFQHPGLRTALTTLAAMAMSNGHKATPLPIRSKFSTRSGMTMHRTQRSLPSSSSTSPWVQS